MTSVLTYQPHLEHPVSCSLVEFELFSCVLGLESQTALSILDPTNIHIELVRKSTGESQGILDATISPSSSSKILKFTSPQLNLRLSYYDMKMFVQLVDRFSKQAQALLFEIEGDTSSSPMENIEQIQSSLDPVFEESKVQYLMDMGFNRDDSIQALDSSKGSIELAVGKLGLDQSRLPLNSDVDMAGPPSRGHSSASQNSSEGSSCDLSVLSEIEFTCTFLSLCIIDDCKDADVPLLELSASQLSLTQNRVDNTGYADGSFSGDYYNRALSGWEPFLEPWKCNVRWARNELGTLGKIFTSNQFRKTFLMLSLSLCLT